MEEDALIYAKDQFDENKLHIYDFNLKKMDYLNFLTNLNLIKESFSFCRALN